MLWAAHRSLKAGSDETWWKGPTSLEMGKQARRGEGTGPQSPSVLAAPAKKSSAHLFSWATCLLSASYAPGTVLAGRYGGEHLKGPLTVQEMYKLPRAKNGDGTHGTLLDPGRQNLSRYGPEHSGDTGTCQGHMSSRPEPGDHKMLSLVSHVTTHKPDWSGSELRAERPWPPKPLEAVSPGGSGRGA